MALPIVPLALAASAVALARNVKISAVDQRVEDRLDDLDEGLSLHRDRFSEQVNGAYRYRAELKLGKTSKGFEIDAAFLGRIRLRKLS